MNDEMLWVACTLVGKWPQTAPHLGERYVTALREGFRRHMPASVPWRFVCFTDRAAISDVPTRPIPDLRSWFSKLYVFSRDAFPAGARVLYLDLDTVPLNDLSSLAAVPIDLPVFWLNEWHQARGRIASGAMSFRSGTALYPIWEEFAANIGRAPPYVNPPRSHPMRTEPSWMPWIPPVVSTDEEWLHHYFAPGSWRGFQQVLPRNAMLSYKYHFLGQGPARGRRQGSLAEAAVFLFHGRPRPHEVREPWNVPWAARAAN